MKILHVTNYGIGGAGIAAYRLHTAQRKEGIDSRMLVRCNLPDDPFVAEIGGRKPEVGGQRSEGGGQGLREGVWEYGRRFAQRLMIRARGWLGTKLTRLLGMEGCSLNILPTGLHRVINASDADIVHLHWINNEMMSIKEIAKIKKPLVWTLHDCWPMLGAEHHSDAGYWRRESEVVGECGGKDVPESKTCSLTSKVSSAVNHWVFRRKQKCWRNLKVSFVAPSNWMAEQVRQSRLFADASLEVIPNGLDTNVFQPLDKKECRRKWNLPQDEKLILFGAYNPMDPNKGCDLLEQALQAMPDRDGVELVVFGAEGSRRIAGLKTHWMGSITSENEMATLYNTADGVCVPSRKESFGQTASESLACGIPVVAFWSTGLIDIVDHQKNGYLADPFDSDDFMKGIMWIFDQRSEDSLSFIALASEGHQKSALTVTCRQKAENDFSSQSVAQQHLVVYENRIIDNG